MHLQHPLLPIAAELLEKAVVLYYYKSLPQVIQEKQE